MELIQLGKSKLKINPIAFGAWAIGGAAWGGNDEKDSLAAIKSCIENGLTTIDTAPIYGYGKSEELVGKALKDLGKRDSIQILTKFGINWNTNKGTFYFKGNSTVNFKNVNLYSGHDGIIKECEDSLRRLKTDYIDLYQIHRPDSSTPISETMETLNILKKEGKILEGAVSNYTKHQMEEALIDFPIASNQVPFSMLEKSILDEVLPFAIEKNVGILAYSPLQRGVLTGKYRGEINWNEDDHRKDSKWFQDSNRQKINNFLDRIQPIARDKNISLSQLVILWTLAQEGISCVLVGGRNPEQVRQNIHALDSKINQEEIELINRELSSLKLD